MEQSSLPSGQAPGSKPLIGSSVEPPLALADVVADVAAPPSKLETLEQLGNKLFSQVPPELKPQLMRRLFIDELTPVTVGATAWAAAGASLPSIDRVVPPVSLVPPQVDSVLRNPTAAYRPFFLIQSSAAPLNGYHFGPAKRKLWGSKTWLIGEFITAESRVEESQYGDVDVYLSLNLNDGPFAGTYEGLGSFGIADSEKAYANCFKTIALPDLVRDTDLYVEVDVELPHAIYPAQPSKAPFSSFFVYHNGVRQIDVELGLSVSVVGSSASSTVLFHYQSIQDLTFATPLQRTILTPALFRAVGQASAVVPKGTKVISVFIQPTLSVTRLRDKPADSDEFGHTTGAWISVADASPGAPTLRLKGIRIFGIAR